MKPIRFDPSTTSLDDFSKQHRIFRVVDEYLPMLHELFLIRHSQYRFEALNEAARDQFVELHLAGRPIQMSGSWFYFPWNGTLVHFLSDALYQELRTARNRDLITDDEQQAFSSFKVGIAGLSVGSHAALTLAMMGGARKMRIADPDAISASNLNRIRLDASYIGTRKCDAIAGLILQTNPYAEIDQYPEGLSQDSIESFLSGLDVLVECMDNLELKIRVRIAARKLGIPVLMATDNGEGIILDVERYDLDPDTELFNGIAGPLTLEEFRQLSPQDIPKLATQIVGIDAVAVRMLESVGKIGKGLYSWPQLGDAATLTGVVVAYAIKRMANHLPLSSGRTIIDLDSVFDPDYFRPDVQQERQRRRIDALRTLGFDRNGQS